jgi:hypothetical protein
MRIGGKSGSTPLGGKYTYHNRAVTKWPRDNRPEQYNQFTSLHPQRLMPEKEFFQQAKGRMVWFDTMSNMRLFPEIATNKSIYFSHNSLIVREILNHFPRYFEGLRIRSSRSASNLLSADCRRVCWMADAIDLGNMQICLTI